ncbi:MAG: hypothetical protein WA419_20045, partial [Silvibacterium sp.]
PPWTFAVLALALALSISHSANAQRLAPDAISVADSAALHARQGEIAATARIYGYDLEEGNWSYQQAVCSPMPETILLRYIHKFSDGTESLFMAAVPRGAGRVRIVPVLYRNATPFVPAPKNPRNFALFHDLVPQAIAPSGTARNDNWLQLGACYAELTGGSASVPSGSGGELAIAGEPQATIHQDVQDHTTRVTFAGSEGARGYTIWSVSFNKNGRVIAAGSEDHSVYVAKATPQVQPAVAASMPEANRAEEIPEESKEPSAASAPSPVNPARASVNPASASALPAVNSASASEQSSRPGWKVMPHPAEPVWKTMAPAPTPPEKVVPEPANASDNPAPEDQSPQ